MSDDIRDDQKMQAWHYDNPPTLFDFAQNNLVSNGLRLVLHVLLRIYLALFHRLAFVNGSRARETVSTLIAANHSSHLDVLVIQAAFPLLQLHQIRSLAAMDYFFGNPFIRLATFFIANTIPLNRKAYDPESFGFSQACLNNGANIIVFPEGTRTLTGEIQAFRPGIGILAQATQARVLPVYIDGAYASFGKGHWLPKPRKITVVFGEPLTFGPLEPNKASWQGVARDVEASVRALKGKFIQEEK